MVLTLATGTGRNLRKLRIIDISQFLLELRQHDGVASVLHAGVWRRVPVHRLVLEQLSLVVFESWGLSRGRHRLAWHEGLELLALLRGAWQLRLQVR